MLSYSRQTSLKFLFERHLNKERKKMGLKINLLDRQAFQLGVLNLSRVLHKCPSLLFQPVPMALNLYSS
jgi:hypothetical protein